MGGKSRLPSVHNNTPPQCNMRALVGGGCWRGRRNLVPGAKEFFMYFRDKRCASLMPILGDKLIKNISNGSWLKDYQCLCCRKIFKQNVQRSNRDQRRVRASWDCFISLQQSVISLEFLPTLWSYIFKRLSHVLLIICKWKMHFVLKKMSF